MIEVFCAGFSGLIVFEENSLFLNPWLQSVRLLLYSRCFR